MQVMCAIKAANIHGSIAMYFFLMRSISTAKITAATGVPNTAANPAAIPQINKIWVCAAVNFSHLANCEARLPPICTAVPSRPAEPPNKCVQIL